MEEIKKYGSIAAFLLLGGISCWATEHSVELLLQSINIPVWFIWGITIAFFIVASIGTKMIMESLDHDNYLEHRRRKFWIGVTLVVIFWLIYSLPTNTHTFFYSHSIANVAKEDLKTTAGYLRQISEREVVDPGYNDFVSRANERFNELNNELHGYGRTGQIGNSVGVMEEVNKVNNVFREEGVDIALSYDSSSRNANDVFQSYQDQFNNALNVVKDTKYKVPEIEAEKASELLAQIEVDESDINKMSQKGKTDDKLINNVSTDLLSGYTIIKDNKRFVKFANDIDAKKFTSENLETRTKRMLSVTDVFADFVCGKYPMSFIWYVLLSILIDVAAFLFFDYAFKQQSNLNQ